MIFAYNYLCLYHDNNNHIKKFTFNEVDHLYHSIAQNVYSTQKRKLFNYV